MEKLCLLFHYFILSKVHEFPNVKICPWDFYQLFESHDANKNCVHNFLVESTNVDGLPMGGELTVVMLGESTTWTLSTKLSWPLTAGWRSSMMRGTCWVPMGPPCPFCTTKGELTAGDEAANGLCDGATSDLVTFGDWDIRGLLADVSAMLLGWTDEELG